MLERNDNEIARAVKLNANGTAQMLSFKVPSRYGHVCPSDVDEAEKVTYADWEHQGACAASNQGLY